MNKKFLLLFLPFLLQSCDSISDSISNGSNKDKIDTVTIFSINDLHGSIEESPQDRELGIAKLDYAIKHDQDYDSNSIIISTGDSWEGGLISHEDKPITDKLLGEMGVSAMVLGNHDFSWGIDEIKNLKSKSPYPYIACNIYDNSKNHTNVLSNDNIIINRGNRKIGIIGTAIQNSISNSVLDGYTISKDLSLITNQVNYLNKQKCDLVIMAVHDSAIDGVGYASNIANTFTQSQIQGIFGGHTHKFEKEMINSIPFVQGGCNSQGYCKMKFSLNTKKVISYDCVKAYNQFNNISESQLNQTMVNEIKEAHNKYITDEKLCEFDQTFKRREHLNKFIPYCMVNEVKRLGYKSKNELIGVHNLSGIRADIPAGFATKNTLFKVEPFDNIVKIVKDINGSKLSKLIGSPIDNHSTKYNCYYCESDTQFQINYNVKYDVISIDYVLDQYFKEYNQYDIDFNNQSDISKNKKKYILDTIVDFIKSEKDGSTLKLYKGVDFL